MSTFSRLSWAFPVPSMPSWKSVMMKGESASRSMYMNGSIPPVHPVAQMRSSSSNMKRPSIARSMKKSVSCSLSCLANRGDDMRQMMITDMMMMHQKSRCTTIAAREDL